MTRMSDPVASKSSIFARNHWQSWRVAPLARRVHAACPAVRSPVAILCTSMLVGCVIPPSLSIGGDAGVNSPPAILLVTSDQQALPEPGPVVFDVGPTAGDLSV